MGNICSDKKKVAGTDATQLYCSCFHRDFLHIKISVKFNFDLFVTFLNFDISSRSNYIVGTITLRNTRSLSKLYMNVLHINIADKFDVDLYVTFQTMSSSTYFVNAITLSGIFGSSSNWYMKRVGASTNHKQWTDMNLFAALTLGDCVA